MDLHYEEYEAGIKIKQEYEYNAVDDSCSYSNCEDHCNSIRFEEVKIGKSDEFDSTTPPLQYMEDNKAAIKEENENIKDECCIDTLYRTGDFGIRINSSTSMNETCSSSLKGIKDERSIGIGKPSKFTADTKECIKVEKDMLAFNVKVEEQESDAFIDSTKLEEVLTEELHIKSDSDVSNNGNSDRDLDRFAKKKNKEKEYDAVHRKADKASFVVHNYSEGCAKKTSIVRKRFQKLNKYICTKCDKIFKMKLTLDDHVVKKHVELISSVSSKIHQCKHCSYKTTFAKHLRKHVESGCRVGPKLPQRSHPCIHCGKIFMSKNTLDDHVIKMHEEFIASVSSKIHQCEHCSYKTTFQSRLAGHMKKCHPESSRCVHCDAIFKNERALNHHIIKNHEEFIASVSQKIHRCEYCSYKTTLSSNLASHMTTHPESGYSFKQRPCIHCDEVFKSKQVLDDHVGQKHKEFIVSVSQKIHQCKHCSYRTTKAVHLASHMRKHPESGCSKPERPHPCIYCDKTFLTRTTLDDHVIKKHKEYVASVSSKIHQCEHCSYKTTSWSRLAGHIKRCATLKPESYRCIHCDKIFKDERALNHHVIRNHEEFIASVSKKIHQCIYCSYKSTLRSHLTRHMKTHPESGFSFKQTPCIHCGVIFRDKRYLNDHILKNHEEFISSVPYKIHECKHCSYKTTIPTFLAKHMTEHPELGRSIKQMSCIHCDEVFKSKQALDDHVIEKHKEFIASVSSELHQCKHCSYKTTLSSDLASHMTTHPEFRCSVEESQCVHCDKIFKTKRGLDDHVLKKHEEFITSVSSKIYRCKHCSYKTTITLYLARHMKKHLETGCDGVKQKQCIHCDETFKTKRGLDNHVVKKHEEFIATVSSKIYQCQHCNYKTTISYQLASHITGCSVEQSRCIHCDRKFNSKQSLDDHVLKKHEEFIASVSSKQYQCKHCSYKTTITNYLGKHMKKHLQTGCDSVKRRQCIHCDAKFKSKVALDNHVMKNHEEFIATVSSKIYQCQHCNYKTTISTHLADHMNKHA